MERLGRSAAGGRCRPRASPAAAQKNAALAAAAQAVRRDARRHPRRQRARPRGGAGARASPRRASSACVWMPQRVEAIAASIEDVIALPDPIGTVAAEWQRPNGLTHPAGAGAARGDRHHLREPPQRDRGCGRAVPEVRQRGHPARRLRERALQRARIHACLLAGLARRAACRPRASSSCPPADRAAVGYMLAGMSEYIDVHRAARRQEPGGARAEGSARAGDRAPRGQLPRVRRPRRRPAHGAQHRAECQDAPHRHLRRRRDPAGGSRRARPRTSRRS